MSSEFLRQPLPIETNDRDWSHFARNSPTDTDGSRIYVIGDIHGNIEQLQAMQSAIAYDRRINPAHKTLMIYLGDFIDRGWNSAAVIDLVARQAANPDDCQVICLSGNHEAWLLEFLADPLILSLWGRKGGLETLHSYGFPVEDVIAGMADGKVAETLRNAFLERLPPQHLDFIRSLRLCYRQGTYLFAHAGVNPDRPLDNQDRHDLIWIRDPFLTSNKDFGAVVVHGHSAGMSVESLPNRINVDTGIYATGALSCVVLEGAARDLITVDFRKTYGRRRTDAVAETGP